MSSCASLLGGDGKILININSNFRTELGFGTHTSSWVTLMCVRVAGFGTTQVELLHQRQEKVTQRSSAFSLLPASLMHVQLWYLGVAAFETAIGRSQEKLLSCLEHGAKALSSNPGSARMCVLE